MREFAKSILNYFAANSETRFRFNRRLPYVWSDDWSTLDLSVHPSFQKDAKIHNLFTSTRRRGLIHNAGSRKASRWMPGTRNAQQQQNSDPRSLFLAGGPSCNLLMCRFLRHQ